MGGRGTFAIGIKVKYQYETVDYVEDVKVLKGLNGKHDLPVESHSINAYIKLNNDNSFNMIRFYNEDHYLIKEIAYHPEPFLDPSRKPILHIHEYEPGNLNNRPSRLLTENEYNQYKKYFKGELKWKVEK